MDFNNFLFHYRISELEKSEEKETTQIRRRGRPRKSAASEPLVEEKPQETPIENPQKTPKLKPVVKNEEVDENKQVLKTINDSRKDFLSSLDSSDEKEKNEEENCCKRHDDIPRIRAGLLRALQTGNFVQARFVEMDKDMYDEVSDTPAKARTSNQNGGWDYVRRSTPCNSMMS